MKRTFNEIARKKARRSRHRESLHGDEARDGSAVSEEKRLPRP
jgi:hypothetical protein